MNKIDELEINSEESRKKFDESLSNLLDQLNVNDKELVTELFITVLGKWMIFHRYHWDYVSSVLERSLKGINIKNENPDN